MLAQLGNNRAEFASLSKEFGGVIQLLAYLRRFCPDLQFDSEITEVLGSYSLAVDCDFDWLYSDRRVDSEFRRLFAADVPVDSAVWVRRTLAVRSNRPSQLDDLRFLE